MVDYDILLSILPWENPHRMGLTSYECWIKYCEVKQIGKDSFKGLGLVLGGIVARLFNLQERGEAVSKGAFVETNGERKERNVWYKKIDGGRKEREFDASRLEGNLAFG